MTPDSPTHLKPRKKPRQARAQVTVDAIFEATVQVLVAVGPQRMTTTRVAERAGVSIGTLYQYFPHKQALVYAVNENYLDALAARIEVVCKVQQGAPIKQMVGALVTAYWDAKTERPEVTRALYRSVAELDNASLIAAFAYRMDAATAAMFASAPDADFPDLSTTNLALLSTIFGTVRNVFERRLPDADNAVLREQLILMCNSYVETVRRVSA